MKQYYPHSIELPFSGKNINFREFTTEEQLSLAKASVGFSDDLKGFFSFMNSIFSQCIDTDINCMDCMEYLLLIIKIRSISSGSKIELYRKIDEQNAKITIDLTELLKTIYNNLFPKYHKIIEDKMSMELGFPLVLEIGGFIDIAKTHSRISETFPFFIKRLNHINWTTMPQNIKEKAFGEFPISLLCNIEKYVYDVIEHLSKSELFNIDVLKGFTLNLYNNSYFELLKFICTYDIKSIHQEIYMLANLNPIYVKTISPSERKIYLSILKEEKMRMDADQLASKSAGIDILK